MSIAIRAEHLSKEYRLGTINHGMLFKDLQSWMARRMGKPDPHEKIGASHYEDQPDRFWALKDVSFDIEQGDRVGVIGRNGAGKSTLLKILSRITAPTEGRVKIKGRVVSLLEVGTGFHPELTGRENIFLNGAILGMKRRQVAKKLDEIIAFSEIEKFIDTPVKRYSSGMYVRLAFAVAAHLDSDILLADEVLAVGDASFQKKCLGKMEDVSKNQGRTVLFVSHNMGSVKQLCRSGILLTAGRNSAIVDVKSCISSYLDSRDMSEIQLQGKSLEWASVKQVEENIVISARYSDKQFIDKPCLGFVVYDYIGNPIFGLNPRNIEMSKVNDTSNGKNVLVKISQPKLLDGVYSLSLWFGDSHADYLYLEHCIKLEVSGMISKSARQSIEVSGPVFPECTYQFS